jgi:AraC family transcriptional regulator, regulatory protein of adaptative response / methylated-DNA-[protein]-cysteine methyltransferase
MAADYIRIEKAIRYLESNYRKQPSLDDLAHHLGLSAFHFQRLFRRWVGISPKRFLQFLTVEYAKGLLDESRSLLDVTYESGLSSPGRLHDLFVTIEAMTPGEFKNRGQGLVIFWGIHQSPFGDCLLAVTDRGICGLAFVDRNQRAVLMDLKSRWPNADFIEKPSMTKKTADSIFKIEKADSARPLKLLLLGTNFQLKVWEALIRIPSGHLCSYEDVAKMAGNENAIRAAANAVAANPISYLIPCHRVIQKMGVFGNYHWGATRKKAIIAYEAAHREKAEIIKAG